MSPVLELDLSAPESEEHIEILIEDLFVDDLPEVPLSLPLQPAKAKPVRTRRSWALAAGLTAIAIAAFGVLRAARA